MAFDSFYDGYLICVLNWGLGHATRCIPIIEKLIRENKRVILASDGQALELLKHEFPQLACYTLPTYGVSYSESNQQFNKLILQIPQFALARHNEHQVTEDIVLKERIGFIISDNRYGCWHLECKNYIVAHQLKPILSGAYKYFEFVLELLMMSLLSNFDEIWIPDEPEINLSGRLNALNIEDKRYIGLLSRMPLMEKKVSYVYDVLFILSGPEPQRSILEEKIVSQQNALKGLKCLLVRGVVGPIKEESLSDQLHVVSWLDKEYLVDAISNSRHLVCRSGYSSIMDLAVMGKKAMLIPTPGQSEQEYLGKKMMDENRFYSCSQDRLDLADALPKIETYEGINPPLESSSLNVFTAIFKIQESSLR